MVTPSASMLRARPLGSSTSAAASAAHAQAAAKQRAAAESVRATKQRDLTGNTLTVDWSERSFVAARRAAPTPRGPRKRSRTSFVTYTAPRQETKPTTTVSSAVLPPSSKRGRTQPSHAGELQRTWSVQLTPAMVAAQRAHAAAKQAAAENQKGAQGEPLPQAAPAGYSAEPLAAPGS